MKHMKHNINLIMILLLEKKIAEQSLRNKTKLCEYH